MNSTNQPSIEELIASANFRIHPTVFSASIFTFLALSIIVAAYRIYLRLVAVGKLAVDDYFMIAAVLSFAASCGVTQWSRELLYLQMSVALVGGRVSAADSYTLRMIDLGKMDTIQYMLEWIAIYCVKFSYLFFFRPLVKRIHIMEIWWKILVGLMTAIALPTILLSFWVCPHYDASFLPLCIQNGSVYVREQVLLTISTANDIATDVLIISLPLFLLTRVQLELKRKLALGAVLCLSIFMIIIASIRYALCGIQGHYHPVPDSIWLFFWQSVECFVAISMVSLTAFRSLYGQAKKSKTQIAGKYINVANSDDSSSKRQVPGRSITKSVNIDITSEANDGEELYYMEKPSRAKIADRSQPRSSWI